MSALNSSCPRCENVASVPLDAVLVATATDADSPAGLAYICLNCGDLVVQRLSATGLALLTSGGVVPIATGPEHQEQS
jgi:hypothetical protein